MDGAYKDGIVRLNEREAARGDCLRQRNEDLLKKKGLTETKTKAKLEAERAAQTAKEVAVKSDVPKSGIHPVQLPLFSQSLQGPPTAAGALKSKSQGKLQSLQAPDQYHNQKRHWELQPGYVQRPRYASRLQMLQDGKFWAKNEQMRLGDITLEENPPIDSFKAVHYPLPRPKEVAEKAMT